jgi:ABC-type antimicrobial peptide transport system permease subunit
VGVVKDYIKGTPRAAGQSIFSAYFSYRREEGPRWVMTAVVHTAWNPLAAIARVRQELRDIDPSLPVLKINTVEEQLSGVLTQDQTTAMLSSFFGVLAVLLACLGLYGVISYAVARRTNEIGIRLALGATPANVCGLILKESLWLALTGIALGAPATLAATRLISSRLFGISAADPLTIGGGAILIIAVAGLAALLPARRASRVDPMVALRYE